MAAVIVSIVVVIIAVISVHMCLKSKADYVHDLTRNRKCNYFEIYDIDAICKTIPECSNEVHIDKYLPESIGISVFKEKGWGLVSKIACKKDDILYKSLVGRFPTDGSGIKLISKEHGVKQIEKDIHCGDIERQHDIFSYFDCLLNHSDAANAYHDINLWIENGSVYVVLKAKRDIPAGEEITINYIYLFKYVYYFQSYIHYIYDHIFNNSSNQTKSKQD
jgi:hypothetical protein